MVQTQGHNLKIRVQGIHATVPHYNASCNNLYSLVLGKDLLYMCRGLIFSSQGGQTVKIRRIVTVPKLIKDFHNVPVLFLKVTGFIPFYTNLKLLLNVQLA